MCHIVSVINTALGGSVYLFPDWLDIISNNAVKRYV